MTSGSSALSQTSSSEYSFNSSQTQPPTGPFFRVAAEKLGSLGTRLGRDVVPSAKVNQVYSFMIIKTTHVHVAHLSLYLAASCQSNNSPSVVNAKKLIHNWLEKPTFNYAMKTGPTIDTCTVYSLSMSFRQIGHGLPETFFPC